MNRFQQCLSKCTAMPAWTETSYSYSVCRDVNTHNGIERCVMYLSSFRTFPTFLNPTAHSAYNTWATLWSFRGFSSKTQSSFILSTITEQWKFSYRIFTYIQNEIYPFWMDSYKLWFHCPLTIQKSVSQKSQNRLYSIKKIYHKKSTPGNRISVACTGRLICAFVVHIWQNRISHDWPIFR